MVAIEFISFILNVYECNLYDHKKWNLNVIMTVYFVIDVLGLSNILFQ